MRKNEEKKMTKGCKIWLWIMLVAQIISVFLGVIAIIMDLGSGIYTILVSTVAVVGISILLFKHKRFGFYLYVIVVVVGLVFNIKNGIDIGMAVLMAIIAPLITFLFIHKNQNVFS